MPGQSPMAEGSFGPITDDGRWTNPAPIAGSATNVVTQETQLTAASKKKNILHSAVEQWKSASLPQKIIAGLLPGEVVATRGSDVLNAQLLKNNVGAGCTCVE